MQIDENTKIIGRFHKVKSPRGLNIYNPLFDELKINAKYILFYNEDPKKLFDGLRKLNLTGAITAGFEGDRRISKLVDKLDKSSEFTGKVGFVTNKNGVVTGYSQGGEGMYRTINKVMNIKDKKLVFVGAGNVCKSLLRFILKSGNLPSSVEIYNRDIKKVLELKKKFKFVKAIGGLEDLKNAKGDLLVNISDIGGSEKDILFTAEIVKNFKGVADVTFETENTNLIKLAKKLNKKYATGWDMFTFQGQVILETMLEQKIPSEILYKHVKKGLSKIVK
jgi:shikimate 5-dehydrogenase